MKIAEIQFNSWEAPAYGKISEDDYKTNDQVVINLDANLEMGKILTIGEIEAGKADELEQSGGLAEILRKATLQDLEKKEELDNKKTEAMEVCKKMAEKNQLRMKLVDAHFSLDDKKITFAFIADGRIDFRQLVKDLIRHFSKNVRLQQLGVRDEVKIDGDIGACGLTCCCKTHLKVLGNVSAEQAEAQQISHRGADRLSGICNRLKCCLRYENDLYVEMGKNFPALGSKVKTPKGKGNVVEWHVLKQSVSVKLDDGETYLEVPIKELN